MRRSAHRHPVVENAVIAAALILAAFVGRELWRRRPSAQEEAKPAELKVTRPAVPQPEATKRTETAVVGVAPIKLTRIQPGKPRQARVPAPKQN